MARLHRLFALVCVIACVQANSVRGDEFIAYLDGDGDGATGCAAETSEGTVQGMETMLVTNFDDSLVTGVTVRHCSGGVFGVASAVSAGGWPVGIGLGVDASDVVETLLPLASASINPARLRVAFAVSDDTGTARDAVAQALEAPIPGTAALIPTHPIPTLSAPLVALLALLLALAVYLTVRRNPGMLAFATLVVAVGGVVSLAWASVNLDGGASDWDGVDPVALDVIGDGGERDLRALFVQADDQNLYLRGDLLRAPIEIRGNQSPEIEDQTFLPSELPKPGGFIGAVQAADPDGEVLSFGIEGDALGFALDAEGLLSVGGQALPAGSYALTVRVTDPLGASSDAVVRVELPTAGGLLTKLTPAEWEDANVDQEARLSGWLGDLAGIAMDLGLGSDHELRFRRAITDAYGGLHGRFRQYYKNVRVWGGEAILHLDPENRPLDPSTRLYPDLDFSVEPAVDVDRALLTVYSDLSIGAEADAGISTELVVYPLREINQIGGDEGYAWQARDYCLCWLIKTGIVETEPEVDPWVYLIDAGTGETLMSWEDYYTETADGLGITSTPYNHDAVGLKTTKEGNQYRLVDPTRGTGRGNIVRDNQKGKGHFASKSVDFIAYNTNTWGNGVKFQESTSTQSPVGQTAGADVAFGMRTTWDLLYHVLGFKGLDGSNRYMDGRVHHYHDGELYSNAHWTNAREAAYFGDNSDDAISTYTRLMTVGHEFGHGLWFFNVGANSNKAMEARGLNEGHGDILGSLVEFYTYGNGASGSTLRHRRGAWNWRGRMLNPKYDKWVLGMNDADHYQEHDVGTLYGHYFLMLSDGANPDPDSGFHSPLLLHGTGALGLSRAAELWLLATTSYMPEDPTFHETRAAWISASDYLFGAGSVQSQIVRNAWAAIGVGSWAFGNAASPVISDFKVVSADRSLGAAYVELSASDDSLISWLEYYVDGKLVYEGAPVHPAGSSAIYHEQRYIGLPLNELIVAPVDFEVRVRDTSGHTSSREIKNYMPKTPIERVASGRLETPVSDWNNYWFAVDMPFQGERALIPKPGATSWTSFSISNAAASAQLRFWIRIEPNISVDDGSLHVKLQDSSGNTLKTLFTFSGETATTNSRANDYQVFTADLTAYRGKSLRLAFEASAPFVWGYTGDGLSNELYEGYKYRVDSVSVIEKHPQIIPVLAVDASEGEGYLSAGVQNTADYAGQNVWKVAYYLDGQLISEQPNQLGAFRPMKMPLSSLAGLQNGVAYSLTAKVLDWGGKVLGVSASYPITLKGLKNLVQNAGFEDANYTSAADWNQTNDATYWYDGEIYHRAFEYSRLASLNDSAYTSDPTISQQIVIPSDAHELHFGLRYHCDTAESNKSHLILRLENSSGNAVYTKDSGPLPCDGYPSYNDYHPWRVNLPVMSLRGKTLKMVIRYKGNQLTDQRVWIDLPYVTWRALSIQG